MSTPPGTDTPRRMSTPRRISALRIGQLLRKEFRQLLRDPRAKRLLFAGPVIQLLIFGYAVTTDVKDTKTFLVDHDRTAESRSLVEALTSSGYFRVTGRGERPADLVSALDHGDVLMGVEIPQGFSADVAAGRQATVQLLVDGSTANTANLALGYATQIIGRYGLQRAASVMARAGPVGMGAGVDYRVRAWYNPNLESRVYNVPAVMGMILMTMTLLLTSLAVVREREIGTLEQLMVSPLQPVELIIGKTLPSVVVALADLVLVVAIALFWFDIPFRGSYMLLGVASLCFILTGLGMGLLISTVSKTQQEAFMSMVFFLLPAIMLSGFMFPIENMPQAMQYLTYLDPVRYYLVVVRGVFLRGAGWQILWPQVAVLLGIGLLVLGFATTRFRKTTS